MSQQGNGSGFPVKSFVGGFCGALAAILVVLVLLVVLLLAGRHALERKLRSLIPGLGAPLPTIVLPGLGNLPQAGTPISIPTITLPNITVPTITLPTVVVPTIALPDFTVPTVTVPDVSLPIRPSLPGGLPGVATAAASDCYTSMKAWVSTRELGEPATTFASSDAIYPVAESGTICGLVKARLSDSAGNVLHESARPLIPGRIGFGNLSPARNLAPASYHITFWHDATLLQDIVIVVQ